MAFEIRTDEQVAIVDITDRVGAALAADATGSRTVFVEHTTAGVCLNEAEPRLLEDMSEFVESLAPATGWRHDELDDNADAHLRSMLLGRSVTIPVEDGQPDLGTWQSILLVDCDGPRTRRVRLV
jgi:secondary thiamine-phosphate synthase enzyme